MIVRGIFASYLVVAGLSGYAKAQSSEMVASMLGVTVAIGEHCGMPTGRMKAEFENKLRFLATDHSAALAKAEFRRARTRTIGILTDDPEGKDACPSESEFRERTRRIRDLFDYVRW